MGGGCSAELSRGLPTFIKPETVRDVGGVGGST